MSHLETLLRCDPRESLRATWLALTDAERRELRPNQELASHAWTVLKRSAA